MIHDEGQTQGWGRAPRPAATGSSWAPSPAGTVLLGTGGTVLCPGPSGPSDPGLGPQWPHPAEERVSWAQSPLALIPLCSGLRVGPWPPRCWGPSWPVPTRRCRRRSAEAPRGARPLLGACARAVSARGRDELCSRRAVTVKNVAGPWSPAARPRRAPAPHLSAASGRALRESGASPGPGAERATHSRPCPRAPFLCLRLPRQRGGRRRALPGLSLCLAPLPSLPFFLIRFFTVITPCPPDRASRGRREG